MKKNIIKYILLFIIIIININIICSCKNPELDKIKSLENREKEIKIEVLKLVDNYESDLSDVTNRICSRIDFCVSSKDLMNYISNDLYNDYDAFWTIVYDNDELIHIKLNSFYVDFIPSNEELSVRVDNLSSDYKSFKEEIINRIENVGIESDEQIQNAISAKFDEFD